MCASCGSSKSPYTSRTGWRPRCRPIAWRCDAGAEQELRRVQRAAATTTAPARTVWRAPPTSTYSTPSPARPRSSTRSTFASARSSSRPRAQRVVDVRVLRRLAGVGRAALEARAAAHAVAVRVGVDGLELGAERAEPGLDRVDALRPVGPLPHAEDLLDPVVVRERGRTAVKGSPPLVRQASRVLPLCDVALVGAERDLGVDRRRPADAAAGEEGEHLAVRKRGQPQGPEEVVRRLRLPADEVRGREVGPGLEQEHVAAALGELACDHAAASAGADHDDVEGVSHAIPRYDQSLARRVASGELKSISAHAPGPSLPGATKSL